MKFSDIIGHEEIKSTLVSMADSSRVAHAIMFYENEGCGALALALAFVQYLNCGSRSGGDSCGDCPSCKKIGHLVHPDVHFIFPVTSGSKVDSSKKPTSVTYLKYWRELVEANPYFTESELYTALGIENKSGKIAVAEAKYVLDTLALTSVEDGWRAVIFYLPEKMNQETANRLLKTIEEPPEKTLFLFITHNPSGVMQTISSRCQHFRLSPLSVQDVERTLVERFGKDPKVSHSAAAVSGGSVGEALKESGDREEYDEFMSLFKALINSILSRDLNSALTVADNLAALDSREKQKAFCIFAEECVRKILLYRAGMPEIARAWDSDASFYRMAAAGCKSDFCAKAAEQLDITVMMIERNVNQKILFCDLVNRMFLSI